MRRANADRSARVKPSVSTVVLDAAGQARLSEAMALLGADDAREVIAQALEELVERQRFLALVAKHETAHPESA